MDNEGERSVPLRIAAFYINISAGHRRAAEAIADAVLERHPGAEVTFVDGLDLVGNGLKRIISGGYLDIIRKRPAIWDFLYDNHSIAPGVLLLRRILHGRGRERFRRRIKEINPDVIVCTQAIPAGIIGDLKAAGSASAPLISVATDFGIHLYWAHPEVDLYAVPSTRAAARLVLDGVKKSRTVVTGIPIRKAFVEPPSREEARQRLGISPNERVVAAMSGGCGLGLTPEHVAAIEASGGVDRVLVLTGDNASLKDRVRAVPETIGVKRTVYGKIPGIEDYYAASDLLVTKPGGLTMAEATALSVPTILISPLPGQEAQNAKYLTEVGAAVLAQTPDELAQVVKEVMSDEKRRRALSIGAASAAHPGAAGEIADLIVNLAEGGANGLALAS